MPAIKDVFNRISHPWVPHILEVTPLLNQVGYTLNDCDILGVKLTSTLTYYDLNQYEVKQYILKQQYT